MFLVFLFLLFPFFSFFLAFWLLLKSKLSENKIHLCLIIISLFWGILAFSQKSLTPEDTDCIRYYYIFSNFEFLTPIQSIQELNILELLNYIFYPVTAFVVSVTKNVQSMSLFWTFIVYICTYLSIQKLMKYYGCYNQKMYAKIIFFSTFCFMVFVQISELLKNSSAFAVFFYALTIFMTKGNKLLVVILLLVSIGLHPSVILLFPLFLYRLFKTKIILSISLFLFVFSMSTNVISILIEHLPGGTYFEMIRERFDGYGNGESGSIHYIILQLIMVSSALYLWIHEKYNVELEYAVNIILIYFIISTLNISNLTAYLRLSIFSHWLFSLVLIWYFYLSPRFINLPKVKNFLILIMFLMTIRWSIGRITPGGYSSSYMDNSITKILFSTSVDYLSVDYEK